LTSPDDRRKALDILDEGMANGARARELALLLGVGLTTLQRWRRQFVGDGDGVDRRKGSHRHVVSSDICFWSSGDTKSGPADGLLMGSFRWLFDRCLIGVCRDVVVVGCGTCAA
jgi:hypothetical protein